MSVSSQPIESRGAWRPELDTHDVDEARARIAQSYCPHDLLLGRDASRFHARHVVRGTDDIGVFLLGYGELDVSVHAVPFGDFMLFSRPLAGRFALRTPSADHVAGAAQTLALDPDAAHRIEFGAGCRIMTVKLSLDLLDRVGAAEGVPAGGRLAAGPGAQPAIWDSISRFLAREAVPNGLLDAGSPVRSHIAQLAASAAWNAFGQAPAVPARAPWIAVDRARDFIESNADRDIGLIDIAAAAGTSPRSLQDAFRRYLDTSPVRYLRTTRLHRVRRDLRAPDRRETVAEIAYRWGFGHPGRFAGEYRREFGRHPSEE